MSALDNRSKEAIRVSKISLIINLLLSLGKIIAGFVGRSGAMISDGVHSASDVFSTVIVMVGIKAGQKPADKNHPYGHERLECVAAIILAGTLVATGIGIGYAGVTAIIRGPENIEIPGAIAVVAAIISIAVKEWMFQYTKRWAKRINSEALLADAWHHRSDSMSSVGSLCGIVGAKLGFPVMDSIASIIICILIVKTAIDIFADAIGKMTDHSCDEETADRLRDTILSVEGVLSVDELNTREFGARMYVDVEIGVDESSSLIYAHSVAESVHGTIEQTFPEVKHCMVHVNPTPGRE